MCATGEQAGTKDMRGAAPKDLTHRAGMIKLLVDAAARQKKEAKLRKKTKKRKRKAEHLPGDKASQQEQSGGLQYMLSIFFAVLAILGIQQIRESM